jgi:hypothetical protein
MPMRIILARDLPEPSSTVERMVTQPESATAADGFRYPSANIYRFTPAPTNGRTNEQETPCGAQALHAASVFEALFGETHLGQRSHGHRVGGGHVIALVPLGQIKHQPLVR